MTESDEEKSKKGNQTDGRGGKHKPDKTWEIVTSDHAWQVTNELAKAAGKSNKVLGGEILENSLYESKKTLPERQIQTIVFHSPIPCRSCGETHGPNQPMVRIIGYGFMCMNCYYKDVDSSTWVKLSKKEVIRDFERKSLWNELLTDGKINMLLDTYQPIKQWDGQEKRAAIEQENSEMNKLLKDYFKRLGNSDEAEKLKLVLIQREKLDELIDRCREDQKRRDEDQLLFHRTLEVILKGKTPQEFVEQLKRKKAKENEIVI